MHSLFRRSALTRVAHLPLRHKSGQACTKTDVKPKAQQRSSIVDRVPILAHPGNAELLNSLRQAKFDNLSRKAHTTLVNFVARYAHPIRTPQDVESLPVGGLQKAYIYDFVNQLEHSPGKPSTKVKASQISLETAKKRALLYETLRTLPYYGAVVATKIIETGCETIEEFRRDDIIQRLLSRRQKALLAWYDYISKPIPRESIDTTVAFLDSFLKSEQWEVIGVGDYRRGVAVTSQMDIICIHPSHGYVHTPVQSKSDLKLRKEARAHIETRLLSMIRSRGGLAEDFDIIWSTWEGMIRVPEQLANGDSETWRNRIENIKQRKGTFYPARIRLVSSKSRGAALLCTTGDTEYVKYVTNEAAKLGMLLNVYGLWQFRSKDDSLPSLDALKALGKRTKGELSKLTNGYWELLPSNTEEEILDHLGLPYVEPGMRNFANIKV